MNAHTPGPWKAFGRTVYAGETPVALGISEFDAELSPVYANDARHPLKNDDEGEANARLIAAAPDMAKELTQLKADKAELVDACQMVLDRGREDGGDHPWIPGGNWHLVAPVLSALIAKHTKP